jgi:hypothetical protein
MEFSVRLRDISYAWPGSDRVTLELPDLRITPGERLFVRGPAEVARARY